jgi:high affinity Mn2+ porin
MIGNRPGSMRFLGYANFSLAPSYKEAIREMQNGDSTLAKVISGQIAGVKYGGVKYGLGLSVNQELSNAVGLFSRLGWNDGKTATWAFTEIDKTVSIGLRFRPGPAKRPDDHFGLAFVLNGISGSHRAYLNDNGFGFILGDGKLPRYGYEQIMEAYYKVKLIRSIWATADYQFVMNPGYNRDRGPVHIFAIRMHVEF